jgi:hypothetical protein
MGPWYRRGRLATVGASSITTALKRFLAEKSGNHLFMMSDQLLRRY